MTYEPSKEDGPNGPRNNKDQLEQIDRRTAEFEGREYDEPEVDAEDPFSAEHAPAFTLITLMRIYDVQMAILTATHPEMARGLNEIHAQGRVVGSFPYLNPDADAPESQ